MNWIVLSLGMCISVVANSLVTRKLLIKGIPGPLINFINFLGCFIFYTLFALISGRQFALTAFQFAVIIVISVLFNYLGNVFYMQSMAKAPNPGYALIIMKSNAIMTVIFSVILFQSALSVKNIAAIIFVLLFLLLILKGGNNAKRSGDGYGWVWLSLGTFFCFGFMTLATKYLFLQGVDPVVLLVYICGIMTIMFYRDTENVKGRAMAILKTRWGFLIALGMVISFGSNLFQFEAIRIAPNPGYVNAVDTASSALVALAAAWMFGDHLSIAKSIGIAGVIASLAVLLI